MSVITPSNVLSDVVLRNVSLISVLNRFGIPLGLGNATVAEVCAENGIDLRFFLFVVASYLDPAFSGSLTLTKEHIRLTADYLERTNRYYLETQVPNIRIHVTSLLKRNSSDKAVSDHIILILQEMESAVSAHVKRDEVELFPKLRMLLDGEEVRIDDWTVGQSEMSGSGVADFGGVMSIVEDLMQILIRYIRGSFDANLLHGVIVSLEAFRNDLSGNSRLRNNVFFPMMNALLGRLGESKKE